MPHELSSQFELVTGFLLPIVQSGLVLLLGLISKLLRDIRNELMTLDRRMAQTEIIQRELEKRLIDYVNDLRREHDILRNRLDRYAP